MASLLQEALVDSGYEVTLAANGVEGLSRAEGHDLLVVDVMMPKMDGFEMVKKLRQNGFRRPVLFVTAKDQFDDRVKGLDLGGDDYIVKPFPLAEFLARVRAHIRRDRFSLDVLEFADIQLDARARLVRRKNFPVDLSSTEFQILEVFMRSPGEVISKLDLLKKVWNETEYRDENIVEVYMNHLRNKLERFGCTRVLHTLRGRGYVLAEEPKDF